VDEKFVEGIRRGEYEQSRPTVSYAYMNRSYKKEKKEVKEY